MKLTESRQRAMEEVERGWWRYDGHFYPRAAGKARRDVIQRLVNGKLVRVGPRLHPHSPACEVLLTPSGLAALQEARG